MEEIQAKGNVSSMEAIWGKDKFFLSTTHGILRCILNSWSKATSTLGIMVLQYGKVLQDF